MMLLLASIIGEGECDIDLMSTAAADIFVVLDRDAAADDDEEVAAAATGCCFGGVAAATAADFWTLMTLLLMTLLLLFLTEETLLEEVDEELEVVDAENSVWNDLRFVWGLTTMLTIGGTLLKEDLKAVAEMVVGDKGTFGGPGEADERLRPTNNCGGVDEDVEEVDDDVEMRWRRVEPRERPAVWLILLEFWELV